MRVNAGMEYRGFTLRQVKNAADEWLNWNFKRDKEDIYVELDAAGKDQKLMDYLKKALTSYYFIGIVNEASYQEAGDTVAHITITAGAGGLNASGTVKSGFEAYITPIDLSTGVSGAGNPYLSSEFMPFVYRLAGQISQAVISAQISGMKEGRMVLIELETDDEKLVERAGAQLSSMSGMISMEVKKFHKIKAVFELKTYATAYDIADKLRGFFEENNINMWKYSKNIVKLRQVKAER